MNAANFSLTGLRFLRPYLCKDLQITHKSAYIRFFNSTCQNYAGAKKKQRIRKPEFKDQNEIEFRGDVAGRIEALKNLNSLEWPRIQNSELALTCMEFAQKYKDMKPGQTLSDDLVVLRGM